MDLVAILRLTGAVADKSDKNKWHTQQGVISVSGPKFMNWNQGSGISNQVIGEENNYLITDY